MKEERETSQIEIVDLIHFCVVHFRLMSFVFVLCSAALLAFLASRPVVSLDETEPPIDSQPVEASYFIEIPMLVLHGGVMRPVYPATNLGELFRGEDFALLTVQAHHADNPPSAVVLKVKGGSLEASQRRAQSLIPQILQKIDSYLLEPLPENRAYEVVGSTKAVFVGAIDTRESDSSTVSDWTGREWARNIVMSLLFGLFCAGLAALGTKLREDYREKYSGGAATDG